MNKSNFDPLLDDLLADAQYDVFRANLKLQSLRAFRRARLWRRVRRAGAITLSVGIMLAALFLQTFHDLFPNRASLPAVVSSSQIDVPREMALAKPESKPPSLATISNEELLAAFPPGSCFLAELDGRTVLIFHDPKLRDEVMR